MNNFAQNRGRKRSDRHRDGVLNKQMFGGTEC